VGRRVFLRIMLARIPCEKCRGHGKRESAFFALRSKIPREYTTEMDFVYGTMRIGLSIVGCIDSYNSHSLHYFVVVCIA